MAATTYVIDTNVFLSEGKKVLYSLGESDIVIPMVVVEELENKRNHESLGYFAREVLREIGDLRKQGDLEHGVYLGEGHGNLKIELNHISDEKLPETIRRIQNNDTRILAVAHALGHELADEFIEVVLLTKDLPLAIRADLVGVRTDVFGDANLEDENDRFIKNIETYQVTSEDINDLYDGKLVRLDFDVPVNTGVILKGPEGNSALAISKSGFSFKLVSNVKIGRVEGKNAEQSIAVQHLMDNTVGVVSLSGSAGSGKSFLMLAAALELVKDKSNEYERIVIYRPVNPVGGKEQSMGFLPGDANEKMAPYMKPVFDTLGTMLTKPEVDKIKRDNIIEFDSISTVRGRTLDKCIVITDELQNVEKSVIQTLLSRVGKNARVFVGWDTAQRDAKYIGKYDGIFSVVRKLYGHKLFAHVTLKTSLRSPVSQMVEDRLGE